MYDTTVYQAPFRCDTFIIRMWVANNKYETEARDTFDNDSTIVIPYV